MQILLRLANPHKGSGWLKTCQILGLRRDVLCGGVGHLNLGRASRKVLVGGQSGRALTSFYSKAVTRWEDCAAPLASPEITGHQMTLAVNEKGAGESKLKKLSGKRELSSLCSADFGLYKGSGSKAGADRPLMAHWWVGQCWDLGAAALREAPEHPHRAQQELNCMASHAGSHRD